MKQEENWAWKQNLYGQEKLMLIVIARQSNSWVFNGTAADLTDHFGSGPGAVRKAQRLVASILNKGYLKRASNMSSVNSGFILNYTSDMSLHNVNNVVEDKVSNPLNEYNNNNNNNINISNSPNNPSIVSLKKDWATILSSGLSKSVKEKLTKEYVLEINQDYKDFDLVQEAKKFVLYWTEGRRKLKNPKLAWRNWLDRNKRTKHERRTKSIVVQQGGQTKDPFAEF